MASDSVVHNVMTSYNEWVSPRRVNKIHWRNLDDDLQGRINGIRSSDTSSIFSNYFRITDIIPTANIDGEFKSYVGGIEQALNDYKSVASDTYRAQTSPIDWNDLEFDSGVSLAELPGYTGSSLGSTLIAIVSFINQIKTYTEGNPVVVSTGDGYKQIVVKDNGNEYYVTVPTWSMTDNNTAADVTAIRARLFTAESRITSLTNRVSSLESTVAELVRKINSINPTEESDKSAENMWKEQVDEDILYLKNSLTDKHSMRVKIASSYLSDDIVEKLEAIDSLTSATHTSVSFTVDGSGYLYSTEDGTINPRSPMIEAYCCLNSSEVAVAKAENRSFIINLASGYGSQRESGTYRDNIQVLGSPDYANTFIFDIKQDCLAYYITEDSYHRISKNTIIASQTLNNEVSAFSIEYSTRDIDIAANSHTSEIARTNNLSKTAPTVLIRDSNTSSDTEDKWINSEGMITVAHSSNGFTLYNHSSVALTCKIIYQQ